MDKKGNKLEPIEKIEFEIEERFQSLIMEKMNHRKGVYINSENIEGGKSKMTFLCSTRALLGIRT